VQGEWSRLGKRKETCPSTFSPLWASLPIRQSPGGLRVMFGYPKITWRAAERSSSCGEPSLSILEKREHFRLIGEGSVLPGHKIVVVPDTVNPSGFIEGSAPVFDTPGFCRFDFWAQVVKHNGAMLSQSPAPPLQGGRLWHFVRSCRVGR
jgi:hypothetical protein